MDTFVISWTPRCVLYVIHVSLNISVVKSFFIQFLSTTTYQPEQMGKKWTKNADNLIIAIGKSVTAGEDRGKTEAEKNCSATRVIILKTLDEGTYHDLITAR